MSQAAHKQSFCVVSAGFLFTADWGSIRNWKFVLPAAIVAFSLLIFCATALSQEPPSTNTPTGGIWMVQLGSFDDEQNALWLAERLETFGFTAQISAYATNGRTIFRVRVGPALNRENAVAIAEFLTTNGFAQTWVLSEPERVAELESGAFEFNAAQSLPTTEADVEADITPSTSSAPEPSAPPESQVFLEEKVLRIYRTNAPPVLDGVLDDVAWSQAAMIDDMHQYDPMDHGEPSERTVIYLTYDDDNLYVAAFMWDSEPDQIRAREMIQDQDLRFDDAIAIYLDSFNNKRTAYHFQVNPNGSRDDAVFETPTEMNTDWNGVWHAEARINEEGWVAEFSIPFKTLNFDPNNSEWGFNIERNIARKLEEIAWVSYNREVNPGTSGLITGLTGLQQGMGLDIVPSIVTNQSKNFETGISDTGAEPSLDVFYNFTPSLTGVLTLNTDFSATEVDDRQINLTRFSLFYPEKRDFFLQDVDIFSFGGLERNGIPFFSRRIGLSDSGQPVDLEVGAKLTGRVGRWNVGVMDIRQGEFQDVDSSNLFVGRIAANVLEESSIGMIITEGDPQSNLDNSLIGMDFRYRNTDLPGGKTLEGEFWYQQSDTEGVETDQDAWGMRISSPNSEGFHGELAYDTFQANFNPALGFVNRVDIERFDSWLGYSYRPDNHRWIRSLDTGLSLENVNKLSSGLESRGLFFELFDLEMNSGDGFGVSFEKDREVLLEDFEIADGVVIPTGDYEYDGVSFELSASNDRVLGADLEVDAGDFFDGEIMSAAAGLAWRPNRSFFLGLGYEYNDVELPGGDFVTRLIQIDANYAFNARWSWVNLIQYDNESGSVGVNSRLRWNPREGQDLYVVLNHGFDAVGFFSGLHSSVSQFSVKYTHMFRF
ncbi:MAG: SPOR domain-containing protein [Pseudomonadota bacterium]|nr:SPOR domain-containing protein [Pseudomonadota bacterium]